MGENRPISGLEIDSGGRRDRRACGCKLLTESTGERSQCRGAGLKLLVRENSLLTIGKLADGALDGG
jgi:hypothetical protein